MINTILLPALISILSAILVFEWKFRREFQTKKKAEFLEKQITEFYNPMVVLRKKILAQSKIRVEVEKILDEDCKSGFYRRRDDDIFSKIIEKHDKDFENIIMPNYRKMLEIFDDKYYLADESVQEWYNEFYRFVHLWDDWLYGPLQQLEFESKNRLEIKEERVTKFYELLEKYLKDKTSEYKKLFE